MKKAMLSQPMAGKTNEEIVATRERAIATLTEKGYEIINTLFTDEWYGKDAMESRGVVQIPLCFFGKITGKNVSVPCGVFLQGMGKRQRMQDRT